MTEEIYIDDEKLAYEKSYGQGYQDGLSNAENKAYESGFKDGVQNGIQIGYYVGYLQMIKRWIDGINIEGGSQDRKEKLLNK
jgi:hypothetical protein